MPTLRRLTLACVFGLLCWLVGCSAIKPAYNNADTLLYYWLDGYVDFTSEQTVRAKETAQALHHWHRSTQLPAYAKLLRSWQALAEGEVSPAQLCRIWSEQIQPLQTPVMAHLEPSVLWLATRLTAQQLAHLTKSYEKSNAKWRKEWLDANPNEVAHTTVKNQRKRLEHLYGALTDAQLDFLVQAARSGGFDGKRAWALRLAQQNAMIATLQTIRSKNLGEAAAKPLLQAALNRFNVPPEAEAQAYLTQLRAHNCATLAKLHQSTHLEQRAHLKGVLLGYAADFEGLAKNR